MMPPHQSKFFSSPICFRRRIINATRATYSLCDSIHVQRETHFKVVHAVNRPFCARVDCGIHIRWNRWNFLWGCRRTFIILFGIIWIEAASHTIGRSMKIASINKSSFPWVPVGVSMQKSQNFNNNLLLWLNIECYYYMSASRRWRHTAHYAGAASTQCVIEYSKVCTMRLVEYLPCVHKAISEAAWVVWVLCADHFGSQFSPFNEGINCWVRKMFSDAQTHGWRLVAKFMCTQRGCWCCGRSHTV